MTLADASTLTKLHQIGVKGVDEKKKDPWNGLIYLNIYHYVRKSHK